VDDYVYIGTPGVTVSVGAGVAADAYQLSTQSSVLDLDGGTLYTVDDGIFNGAFDESSGTYTAGGIGATFAAGIDLTGGTIDTLSGTLGIAAGGVLAGTLSGAGQLDFTGGATYIQAGFATSLNVIDIGAQARLGFNISFKFKGNFSEQYGGVLDLFGNTLTLSGNSVLDGAVSNGLLDIAGTLLLGSTNSVPTLDNGLVLSDTGTILQQGSLAMGVVDSGSKLEIGKTGQYDIQGNWGITDPSLLSLITNAGTFAKTAGGKLSAVDVSFNNTGTIDAATGELLLGGQVNSLSGTVSGAGTLGIGGVETTIGKKLTLNVACVSEQAGVLVLNGPLSYGGEFDMSAGDLDLNASKAVLTLSGRSDFDGGTISGFAGTLVLDGPVQAYAATIGSNITVDINGTFDQSGTIYFGLDSNPTAYIAKGGSWLIEGDSAVIGFYGLINNAGTLSDPNGSADAYIDAEIVSTGTLTVNNSELSLFGATVLSNVVNGTGLLDIEAASTIGSGTALKVGGIQVDGQYTYLAFSGNESYSGLFYQTGNSSVLLQGNALTLSGTTSLDNGTLVGAGTMTLAGTATLGIYTATGATLQVSGVADQTEGLTLNNATVTISGGATYTLDTDVGITTTLGNGTVANAGTLVAAGTGDSTIDAFVANTGLAEVNDSTLTILGGASLAGTVSGTGILEFGPSASAYTLQSGLTLSVAALDIGQDATAVLAGNVSYAGYFEADQNSGLTLSADTLTLSGTALLDTSVTGPGTLLLASGSTGTITGGSVSGGAVLQVNSSVDQIGSLTVGDAKPPSSSQILISAGANYTLEAGADIGGNGTLTVAGTLTSAGDGLAILNPSIVDTGSILANLGTLDVLGAVGGTGGFGIGTGGELEFGANSAIGASNTVSFNGTGELLLNSETGYGAGIAGFAKGDIIEMSFINPGSISGSLTDNGHLLTVQDGSGDSITLSFTAAQSMSSLSFTVGPHGYGAVIHT
jgi:hypothetical protein